MHDGGELGYLARVIGAGLDDGYLVVAGEAQQGARHTDVVVIVGLSVEHAVFALQHGGDQFLGGRLAVGAGDLYDGQAEALAVEGRKALHGEERIIGQDVAFVATGGKLAAIDNGVGAALLQGLGGVDVAVKVLPAQGEEDGARRACAAVRSHHGMSQINGI